MEKDANSMNIGVKNIYLLGFTVNELVFKEGVHEMDINISQETAFTTTPLELGSFTVILKYVYKETNELVLETKVVTLFHLQGLNELIAAKEKKKEPIILPREVLITCLSLSLSHTRVYLHQNIASTVYANVIPLPIFNPTELANILYKEDITFDKTKKLVKQEKK